MLLAVLVLWLLATAHCKRLHDIGRTGWWQILAWIPIVNLGMVAWLGFSKGQATANQYGPAPGAWWRVGASGDPEYSTPQIETGLTERLDDNKAP